MENSFVASVAVAVASVAAAPGDRGDAAAAGTHQKRAARRHPFVDGIQALGLRKGVDVRGCGQSLQS